MLLARHVSYTTLEMVEVPIANNSEHNHILAPCANFKSVHARRYLVFCFYIRGCNWSESSKMKALVIRNIDDHRLSSYSSITNQKNHVIKRGFTQNPSLWSLWRGLFHSWKECNTTIEVEWMLSMCHTPSSISTWNSSNEGDSTRMVDAKARILWALRRIMSNSETIERNSAGSSNPSIFVPSNFNHKYGNSKIQTLYDACFTLLLLLVLDLTRFTRPILCNQNPPNNKNSKIMHFISNGWYIALHLLLQP